MGRPGRTPWACGALAALSLIVPVWLLWYPSGGILSFDSPIPQAGRVLLVTAHPDDETIFFSPTISALRYAGNEVFLLCFTNGNFHGLGQVRQQELLTAAAALQVDAAHVRVIDHANIQDGHHTDWDEPEMLRILTAETQANSIDTIVTFDEGGVYGHKNHKACFEAVREFQTTCQLAASGRPAPSAALPGAGIQVQTRQLATGPQLAGLAGPNKPQPAARAQRILSGQTPQALAQASSSRPGLQQSPVQGSTPAARAAASTAGTRAADATSGTAGSRAQLQARTAGIQYPSSQGALAEAGGEAGQPAGVASRVTQPASSSGAPPAGVQSQGLERQPRTLLNIHGAHPGASGRRLRAGRPISKVAAWHRIAAGRDKGKRRELAATGRLQVASSSSHAGVKLEAGRGCPKAYQLLTVSKLRKYASMLDVLPSALEGKLHLVTYVNRSIFATFTAMSAHNSQWRWWVHVITTRYTFVNTLQLLGPDARLDNQTAITLAEHEPQRAGSVVSISQDLAELDGQTMDSITRGN